MKQVAYQFARLQQPPAQVSGSTLSFAEKLAHANLAKISGAVRDSFQGRSTPGHSFYDHHHSIVLVVTCFPWSEREVQKRLLDPEYPPMGYISLWTRILNAQPSGIDYQLIHCIWCSTSDEGVRLHVGTSGVGKNLGKLPTVLPRQLLNDEERKHAGL